jgi:hypothetical protein
MFDGDDGSFPKVYGNWWCGDFKARAVTDPDVDELITALKLEAESLVRIMSDPEKRLLCGRDLTQSCHDACCDADKAIRSRIIPAIKDATNWLRTLNARIEAL